MIRVVRKNSNKIKLSFISSILDLANKMSLGETDIYYNYYYYYYYYYYFKVKTTRKSFVCSFVQHLLKLKH